MSDIARLVSLYDTAREQRLSADKVAEELKVMETAAKQALINSMRELELGIAGNSKVSFTLRKKVRAQVADWDMVHEFIVANGAWDLVQRRISEAAVFARMDAGITVPGIEQYEYDELSRPTKVK